MDGRPGVDPFLCLKQNGDGASTTSLTKSEREILTVLAGDVENNSRDYYGRQGTYPDSETFDDAAWLGFRFRFSCLGRMDGRLATPPLSLSTESEGLIVMRDRGRTRTRKPSTTPRGSPTSAQSPRCTLPRAYLD